MGEKAKQVCEAAVKVADETGFDIYVAPMPFDFHVCKETGCKLLGQHVDGINAGAWTGHILPAALLEAGADGSIINHSEKRIVIEDAAKAIEKLKELDMVSIHCVESPLTIERIKKYNPDYIAIEPPELIGGNVSVSSAKPYVITDSIKKADGIPIVCGAGVKTTEDVKIAIELGAVGVLVASGVAKADDFEKAIRNLVQGFEN